MGYRDDFFLSESIRQADHKAASTDAQHQTADAAHRGRLATAAAKWGVKNGSLSAITSRGEVPPAGSWAVGSG